MADEPEIWLPVVGYEDHYEVSSFGNVRRLARGRSTYPGRPVKQWRIWKGGHLGVSLCKHGVQKTHPVHRLVIRAWIGPGEWGIQAHHIDANCLNNRPDNLTYVSALDNYEEQYHRIYTLGLPVF